MIRRLRAVLTVLLCAAASAPAVSAPAVAAPATEVLAYRIEHETWGDIGTFSNSIRREGGRTVVEARLRLEVTLLFGVVVYRETADRREVWQDGRLAAYESTTDVDGDIVRVSGQARGDSFLIQRDDGEVAAPAAVFPTNLWSIDMRDARTVMGTKSGHVVQVEVIDGGRQQVEIGDRAIEARYYRIEPRSEPGIIAFPMEGWFDDADIPVRFGVVDKGDAVVFTLVNYGEVLQGRELAQ